MKNCALSEHEQHTMYCVMVLAHTRTLDLSDSAKAYVVLKAVSHL